MLIPVRNSLTKKLPFAVLFQYARHKVGLQAQYRPQAIVFVPKRQFGQGKKIPIFGHAAVKSSSKYPDFTGLIMALPCLMMLGWSINWKKVREDYGIRFVLTDLLSIFKMKSDNAAALAYKDDIKMHDEIQYDQKVPVLMAAGEKKQEMHDMMVKSALQRYVAEVKKIADKDPEIKALLLGQEVKPENPEAFELKKQWIQDFMVAIQDMETLEESEATTIKKVGSEKYQIGKEALRKLSVFADTGDFDALDTDTDEDPELDSQSMGFRTRKIVEYENRIRQYSTPDKIFRYFATYKVVDEKGDTHIMMTPEDFLRSITPGIKQPENLGLDKYKALNENSVSNVVDNLGMDNESIFQKLSSGGLISFSDYIFLLTVLSTSRRHFEIAFKMFDLNGDGNVDAKEFEVVTNLMKSQSSMGARHRDQHNTGNTYKGINSGLITYFFGENKEGILTVEKFLEFQRQLQNEILKIEFSRKSAGVLNRVSEKEFADLLIAYAGFPAKKKAKMLKRVKKTFQDDEGITLEDFLNFYQVLYSINDIDTALTFYHIAGAPIERSTMKHVAKTVAGVHLSDHVIDVVFVLFDENGDGKLSNKEFISVMKQRVMRGLEKPKDTGIGKILSAMAKCASDTTIPVLKN